MYGELGRDVEGNTGKGSSFAKGRTDVDDAAPTSFDHALGGVLREFDEGANVQIEVLVVRFIGRIKKWSKLNCAGVVDQDIESACEFAVEGVVDRGDQGPGTL